MASLAFDGCFSFSWQVLWELRRRKRFRLPSLFTRKQVNIIAHIAYLTKLIFMYRYDMLGTFLWGSSLSFYSNGSCIVISWSPLWWILTSCIHWGVLLYSLFIRIAAPLAFFDLLVAVYTSGLELRKKWQMRVASSNFAGWKCRN